MLARIADFLLALGPWGILLAAAIDSAGIPMGPGVDALVFFLATKNPDRTWLNVAVAVAGSTIGNLVLYYAARKGGEKYAETHAPSQRTERFRSWFHRYGLVTVFVPAVVPIPMPLKAFVILSGALGEPPAPFICTIVLARILRYGGEGWLGMRGWTWQSVVQHRWHLVGFALMMFSLLYAVAKLAKQRRSQGRG